jgi:hypothetical protein
MKKVKVRIPLYPGVKPVPQFVSVNNYTCIIKPGEEVEVPDFVAEVLKHKEEMLVAGAAYAEAVGSK